jgi:sugar phosphate isomerase/epimerase
MSRPVTLFTGQWADLPIAELAPKAKSFGYGGSSIWSQLYSFPPNDFEAIDAGYNVDGRRSILGSHLNFGERDRGWDFVSPGHGDVDFESILRALNRIGYQGPPSVEWEDAGMDREWGAADAARFVREGDFAPSAVVFDEAFARP